MNGFLKFIIMVFVLAGFYGVYHQAVVKKTGLSPLENWMESTGLLKAKDPLEEQRVRHTYSTYALSSENFRKNIHDLHLQIEAQRNQFVLNQKRMIQALETLKAFKRHPDLANDELVRIVQENFPDLILFDQRLRQYAQISNQKPEEWLLTTSPADFRNELISGLSMMVASAAESIPRLTSHQDAIEQLMDFGQNIGSDACIQDPTCIQKSDDLAGVLNNTVDNITRWPERIDQWIASIPMMKKKSPEDIENLKQKFATAGKVVESVSETQTAIEDYVSQTREDIGNIHELYDQMKTAQKNFLRDFRDYQDAVMNHQQMMLDQSRKAGVDRMKLQRQQMDVKQQQRKVKEDLRRMMDKLKK